MAKSNNTLCLDKFYPEKDLMITDIDQQSDKIIIQMKSTSSSCKCPKCNRITQKYHGTYTRKVQDLPILGKNVQLKICSHEYACLNDECEVVSIAETFDGFLNNYNRMTERITVVEKDLVTRQKEIEKSRKITEKLCKKNFSWLAEFSKGKNLEFLTKDVVRSYIKKISLYEDKRIEIEFKFQDEIQALSEILEEGVIRCQMVNAQ